ncbi:hypothetical protein [Exiguobacterium artemiae]
MARDCDHLMKAGYKVSYIQPYDMFPQTAHVEAIVVLEKRKRKSFKRIERLGEPISMTKRKTAESPFSFLFCLAIFLSLL